MTMTLTAYPNGVSSFGIPVLGAGSLTTTGDVFFVDSGAARASDGNDGKNKLAPMATWDAAIGRCAANNGDIIILMPGHAETITTTITMDVAGVKVVGMGTGRSRPAITPSGAIALLTVSAANCHVENVRLIGQAADSTSTIAVTGDDFTCVNCVIEQGATPLVGVLVTGADRFAFHGCQFIGTAAGPDVAIDIATGDSADWTVQDCLFNYAGSSGLDLAGIRASFDQTGGLVKNCDFIAMDVTAVDINSSVGAQGDGLIAYCNVAAGAAVANIDTLIDAGGYQLIQNYGSDSATAAGGLIPLVTPA